MRKNERREIERLAELSRTLGYIPIDELDRFLAEDAGFDARLDALIEAVPDVRIEHRVHDGAGRLPVVERDRFRTGQAEEKLLRPYLRDLAAIPRMNRDDEIRLAKRLEFARRRFQRLVVQSKLGTKQLETLLPGRFCSSYVEEIEATDGKRARGTGRMPRSRAAQERVTLLRSCCSELGAIRSEYVERNLQLVVNIALGYRTYGVPLMDLVQEGNAALIRAVEKFDWRKDVRFQTYATFWIRQAIERAIAFSRGIVRVPNYLQQKMRRLRREGRIPRGQADVSLKEVSDAIDVKPEIAGHLLETERGHYSLDVAVEDDGQSFASLLADDSEGSDIARSMEFPLLRQRLDEALGVLTSQERHILEYRFGLKGAQPMTLEKVGKRMKVSRERIRQLQVRAIRKLQKPDLIEMLEGFI